MVLQQRQGGFGLLDFYQEEGLLKNFNSLTGSAHLFDEVSAFLNQ